EIRRYSKPVRLRTRSKVMKRTHTGNHLSKRFGNFGIACIGIVPPTVNLVRVDWRMECRLNLCGRSAENDRAPAERYRLRLKAIFMEPLQHLAQIAVRHPKGGAEFLWRHPVPKLRRAGILLGLEQCIERGLLGRIRRERQDHPVHPEVRRNKSFVVLRESQRM